MDVQDREYFGKVYSEKWAKRFAFYENYGKPYSKEGALALKSMGLFERSNITINLWVMLVGCIFFLTKGMWRSALVQVLTLVAVGLVLDALGFSHRAIKACSYGVNFLFAILANYAYYMKEKTGKESWNIFQFIR